MLAIPKLGYKVRLSTHPTTHRRERESSRAGRMLGSAAAAEDDELMREKGGEN